MTAGFCENNVEAKIPLKCLCTCHLRGDKPRVCSHVAAQKTKKGQPIFTDLKCLEEAANLKGFEIVQTNKYNWYNRHVGDYPVPPGMKVGELGQNALFILRMKEPHRSQYRKKYGGDPYDIGVLADPNNEGCYTLIYDFWNKGYGIDDMLGSPVHGKGGEITLLCPELKQTYDVVCEATAAKEAGDTVEVMPIKDARAKYPQYFQGVPESPADDKTWTSIAFTEQRLGVH